LDDLEMSASFVRGFLVRFPSELAHPPGRSVGELGMILIFPGGSIAFKEAQQLSSPHGLTRAFDQKSAAASWPDDRVDFLYQILG
jgi:hypothetical protein